MPIGVILEKIIDLIEYQTSGKKKEKENKEREKEKTETLKSIDYSIKNIEKQFQEKREVKIEKEYAEEDSIISINQTKGSKVKNYLKYFEVFFDNKFDEEEKEFEITNINHLFDELETLTKQTREMIYIIATRCAVDYKLPIWFRNDFIVFNVFSLIQQYNNKKKVYELLSIPESNNYYVEDVDEEKQYLKGITFPDEGNNYDVLHTVVKVCKKANIDLKNIIVNLEFNLLDK